MPARGGAGRGGPGMNRAQAGALRRCRRACGVQRAVLRPQQAARAAEPTATKLQQGGSPPLHPSRWCHRSTPAGAPCALPVSAATCSISADLPQPGGPSSRMGAPRHRPAAGQGRNRHVWGATPRTAPAVPCSAPRRTTPAHSPTAAQPVHALTQGNSLQVAVDCGGAHQGRRALAAAALAALWQLQPADLDIPPRRRHAAGAARRAPVCITVLAAAATQLALAAAAAATAVGGAGRGGGVHGLPLRRLAAAAAATVAAAAAAAAAAEHGGQLGRKHGAFIVPPQPALQRLLLAQHPPHQLRRSRGQQQDGTRAGGARAGRRSTSAMHQGCPARMTGSRQDLHAVPGTGGRSGLGAPARGLHPAAQTQAPRTRRRTTAHLARGAAAVPAALPPRATAAGAGAAGRAACCAPAALAARCRCRRVVRGTAAAQVHAGSSAAPGCKGPAAAGGTLGAAGRARAVLM